jgi:glycosyltransferase involved in cell wall biosynthesis
MLCFHEGNLNTAPGYIHLETVPPPHRSLTQRLLTLIFTRQSDIAGRFFSVEYATKLTTILSDNRFDVVQFEGIEMVCYMPLVRQSQPHVKLCFDTFNAEYALQQIIYDIDRANVRRWHAAVYSRIQVERIKRFERDMCQLADAVIAVSPEDAELLKGFRDDGRVHVVPNGIWTSDYAEPSQSITLGANTLVFTGKMDYRPNVDAVIWFVQEVFPLVKSRIQNTQFYIVGQQPHPRLRSLGKLEGVHITGWVDSVLPYLHAATVYVAPLRMGSGTRLKLLGAMAAGCPIVATSIASSGLLSTAKKGMVIADGPTQIANKIIALLNHPDARQELGRIASEQVRVNYDWPKLIPRMLDVYRSIGLGE